MATVYAHTNDGYVRASSTTSFAHCRDNAAAPNYAPSTGSSSSVGVATYKATARGSATWYIFRSFFYFDTSGITGTVDSATLRIYGRSYTTGDVIAVKSNSDITNLSTADFDAIEGWNSSGVDNESNVTKYSSEISTWSSGYNDITLTSDALTDMENDNTLYVCLMNYDYDLKNVDPNTATDTKNGLYYINYTGTSRDPYIDYTLATVTPTDNAIFFGTNF